MDEDDDEDFYYVSLNFRSGADVENDGEPTDYIYEYRGDINLVGDSHEKKIGSFHVSYMDLFLADIEGCSISDAYDGASETIDFYFALYDRETDAYNQDVIDADSCYKIISHGNALLIHSLVLLSEHRGQGIGAAVVSRIIHRLAKSVDFVALQAYPLQSLNYDDSDEWKQAVGLDDFKVKGDEASAKLMNLYRNLGFKQVGNSSFMILHPDMMVC